MIGNLSNLVIEKKLVSEDCRVEHDLLLLQFTFKFLIRHSSILEEKFGQLFNLKRKEMALRTEGLS